MMGRGTAVLYVSCLALVSWAIPVHGQQAAGPAVQFERITLADGLSQSTVLAIAQDPVGFMWFGTQSGLNRYDGREMEVFWHDPFDSTSIGFRTTMALEFESDGTMWVALSTGINRRDPVSGAFTPAQIIEERTPPGGTVHTLRYDTADRLWVGTAVGLGFFERGGQAATTIGADAPTGVVHAILPDDEGTVWAGMDAGLGRVDMASLELEPIVPHAQDGTLLELGRVRSMASNAQGLWLGTDRGVVHLDPTSLVATRVSIGSSVPSFHHLVLDSDDEAVLWIGAGNAEVFRFDTRMGTARQYRPLSEEGEARASDRVRSMAVDHAGIVWVGTENSGVIRFDPHGGGLEHLLPGGTRFPDRQFVATIYEDRSGGLWTGTMYPGLLARWDRESGERRYWEYDPRDPTSLSEGRINAILEGEEGDIWVGTDISGLNRLHGSLRGGFRHYRHDPDDPGSISSDSLTILHRDRNGSMWVAHYWLGVLDRYNPDTDSFSHFQVADSRLSGSVYAFHEDGEGLFWLASGDLYTFDPRTGQVVDRFRRDSQDPNTFQGAASSIHRSADGTVWLTSLQGGLSRLDPATRQFTHYSPANSNLRDNVLYHVLEDSLGYLWMSSNRGIARFDPRTETFLNLTRGVQSLEFTTFAAFRSPRTGEMFFGGPGGVNAFFPEGFRPNPFPPRTALTTLRIAGETVTPTMAGPLTQPLWMTPAIHLSPTERDVSIDFVALHFRNPDRNRFRYRLRPYDDAWQETTVPIATFTNLDPGDYTFEASSANSDGVWADRPATLDISIAPPWYEIGWVRLVALLVLISGAFGAYRMRVRAIEQRNLRLESEVTDRTREVREQRDRLEEQAASLRELDEVKSRFFANISHEFRTPLTLTFGPIDDALDGRFRSLDEARPHFQSARRNGSRLLRLINQLLDLARSDSGMQSLTLTRRDLGAKIRDMAALFESVAGVRGLELTPRLPSEPFPFAFDADKIEKVVVNLLSNAFKFTPPGGKVDLSLERLGDGRARITVADTGPGIAKEHLPRLFDRFYQTETTSTRSHEGSGIGLSLVKAFVELHGGTVEVESEPGQGARFTVDLPVLEGAPSVEESPAPVTVQDPIAESAPELESLPIPASPSADAADHPADEDLILVVEDNADLRAYITGHLDSAYRVAEAANGEEGVRLAIELVPDLILSDVMMPFKDGIDLCRDVKTDERTSHIPVVLLTARADVADRIQGFESGADAYMPKPFNAKELNARVRGLIEEREKLRKLFSTSSGAEAGDASTGLNPREAAFLEKVHAVAEDHIDDLQFGVDPLAESLAMSRRQLLRKLRALTGDSAVSLIRGVRMKRAAEMLQEGGYSVKEICFAVGFQSNSSFTRSFRQVFGVTPSEYVERVSA